MTFQCICGHEADMVRETEIGLYHAVRRDYRCPACRKEFHNFEINNSVNMADPRWAHGVEREQLK